MLPWLSLPDLLCPLLVSNKTAKSSRIEYVKLIQERVSNQVSDAAVGNLEALDPPEACSLSSGGAVVSDPI